MLLGALLNIMNGVTPICLYAYNGEDDYICVAVEDCEDLKSDAKNVTIL